MKSIYLISALLAAASVSASAQTIVNNPDNHAYLGVRASLDIPSPGKIKVGDAAATKVYKNGIGVSAGLVYNIPLVANLYIEPGLSFYYKANGYKDTPDIIKHKSVRESGFRVPVTFGYHFDFTPDVNMALFVGPELQVGFSSDNYYTAEVAGVKAHSATSNYGDHALPFKRNRAACNLKFGVGFNFLTNYYVGVEGAVGLTNLSATDGIHYKENRAAVTLGYNF